jgi:superfamily II DNA/RNA helicase
MTVKELRTVLQESSAIERGLLSRLKRKQDLIDYLKDHGLDSSHDDTNNDANDPTANQAETPKASTSTSILTSTAIPQEKETKNDGTNEASTQDHDLFALQISPELSDCMPLFLQQLMVRRGITSLLPIQVASFQRIYSGRDVVLQAPTGSGKTLAFVLPLSARKDSSWRRQKISSPSIIVITPSRELTRQVGKEWAKFSKVPVATVFGGVPIERHAAMLKNKPPIVVCTPGRLRELVREGHMDYSQVTTLVLDEADTLLDKSDSPDVTAILENIETAVGEREDPDYQLVLVSATINQNVVEFTDDLELEPEAFIRVQGSESKVLVAPPMPLSTQQNARTASSSTTTQDSATNAVATVQHWHMSSKSSARPLITTDLISILSPRLTLVFVPTKIETESVASFLSSRIPSSNIRVLHGDMAQAARSRSIARIREESVAEGEGAAQVLVCTDVASRGLDLPNVDLVVQFGVPKLAGKEGTYSTELYTHRSGRTGRVRSLHQQQGGRDGIIETANAIMLYDPANGEGKVIPDLVREVQEELGILVQPRAIPSAAQVVEAAYKRTTDSMLLLGGGGGGGRGESIIDGELASYFASKLQADDRIDTNNPQQMLNYLARAMVSLSHLDASTSPFHQHCSLLSGSDAERTLCLSRQDRAPISPPDVTKFCKANGSGKLGRVAICKDGSSAIFDLPTKRANRLVSTVKEDAASCSEWLLELPLTLPDL